MDILYTCTEGMSTHDTIIYTSCMYNMHSLIYHLNADLDRVQYIIIYAFGCCILLLYLCPIMDYELWIDTVQLALVVFLNTTSPSGGLIKALYSDLLMHTQTN